MSALPALTERTLQFKGSVLAAWCLRRWGWRLEFTGLPARQGVIVVYPHTSNVDFPVGQLAKWAMGLRCQFWGKDSLFRIPLFGAWMRWLGGIAVNRSAPGGLVGQTVAHLQRSREQGQLAWLVLAPEGTRSLTPGWRSGFYRVALQAQVPLGLATIDYARRLIRLNTFVMLTGDPVADLQGIELLMGQPQGRRPELASPVTLA